MPSSGALPSDGTQEPSTFRILCVCVANQCRSPMMERLARGGVAARLGPDGRSYSVISGGVRARPGEVMHPLAAYTLGSYGADVDGLASSRVDTSLIRESQLMLAATAAERDDMITMVPAAIGRTFTLLEFARLVSAVPAETLAGAPPDVVARAVAVVGAAQRMRGRTRYVDPALDDLEDPPRNPAAFAECATTIDHALGVALDALCGTSTREDSYPNLG